MLVTPLVRWTGILLFAGFVFALPNPIAGSGPAGSGRAAAVQQAGTDPTPHFAVPTSLLEEHAELYSAFEAASKMPGETGAAARRVIALRRTHVEREQRIAYPLLRLLPMLDHGDVEPWMTELLPLADQLREAVPVFKKEHVAIRQALESCGPRRGPRGIPSMRSSPSA